MKGKRPDETNYIRAIMNENNLFANRIKKMIVSTDKWENKFTLTKNLINFYGNNPTGLYSDFFVEETLCDLAKGRVHYDKNASIMEHSVLHVFTECYQIGGHTKVVMNWIRNDVKSKHGIYFINQKDRNQIPDELKQLLVRVAGDMYFSYGVDEIKKAEHLLQIAQNYRRIVLHVHSTDIVPLLAFSHPDWERPVYLFNHADGLFWIGGIIADAIIEFYQESKIRTEKIRGMQQTVILPLPPESQAHIVGQSVTSREMREKYNIPKNKKIILSVGNGDKYKIIPGYNFPKFAYEYMSQSRDKFLVIIGVMKKDRQGYDWENLRKQENVLILPKMAREEYENLALLADVFLEGFPLGGGQTLIDMMVKKVPIVGLRVKGITIDEEKRYVSHSLEQLKVVLDEILSYPPMEREKRCKEALERLEKMESWVEKWNAICNYYTAHSKHFFRQKRACGELETIFAYLWLKNSREVTRWEEVTELKNRIEIRIFDYIRKKRVKSFARRLPN